MDGGMRMQASVRGSRGKRASCKGWPPEGGAIMQWAAAPGRRVSRDTQAPVAAEGNFECQRQRRETGARPGPLASGSRYGSAIGTECRGRPRAFRVQVQKALCCGQEARKEDAGGIPA